MKPATYNLPEAYRGDSYGPITLRVRDSSGNYIDFSNFYRVDLHVKNRRNYKTVVAWSSEDGTVEINQTSIILNQIPGEKMRMPGGIYDYDLQVYSEISNRTYLTGVLEVIQDVTEIDIQPDPTPTATPTPTPTSTPTGG
jgi:hypothetical protein